MDVLRNPPSSSSRPAAAETAESLLLSFSADLPRFLAEMATKMVESTRICGVFFPPKSSISLFCLNIYLWCWTPQLHRLLGGWLLQTHPPLNVTFWPCPSATSPAKTHHNNYTQWKCTQHCHAFNATTENMFFCGDDQRDTKVKCAQQQEGIVYSNIRTIHAPQIMRRTRKKER